MLRAARPDDVPALVALMAEFYAEASFPLPRDAAAAAFAALIAEPRWGRVWLLPDPGDGAPAGYMVLTVGYGMEYGGLRGFVDDLFVRPAARRRGLARAALREVRSAAEAMGVRVLLVETGPEDARTRSLYGQAGFVDSGRLLMAQPLAPAVHEG